MLDDAYRTLIDLMDADLWPGVALVIKNCALRIIHVYAVILDLPVRQRYLFAIAGFVRLPTVSAETAINFDTEGKDDSATSAIRGAFEWWA